MKNKSIRLVFYTIIGLIIPVLLIYFNIIPFQYRALVLYAVVFTIVLGIYIEKTSMIELGIRVDNVKNTFLPYFFFTLISSILVIWYAQNSGKTPLENWWQIPYLQFIFIPTSIVQEFIYRSFFQTQYHKIFNPLMTILITAILFSFMHILWHSSEFLMMTLFGGVIWGILWYKYPNLLWMSVSHSVLNFLINYFGFITIGKQG